MPSKYHFPERPDKQKAKYPKIILRGDDTHPLINENRDYKKCANKNRNNNETEKQIHLNIQQLAKQLKADSEVYVTTKQAVDTGKIIKYSPKVKIGNWQEQRDNAEDDMIRYLRQRERGQLMIQMTKDIIGQNLRGITITPKKYIRFKDKVQLIARYAKTYQAQGKQEGLSLSCVLTGSASAEMCQPLIEGTVLSASPLVAPYIRNVFEILPWQEDDVIRKDDRLKFGQEFTLRYTGTTEDNPYYVSVSPKRIIPAGNHTGHPEVYLHARKCWANVWRAYNGDPNKRKETMGEPISGGQDIIITSANVNRSLCCETESWFSTFFGLECEATAYTYYNVYGAETANNLWYMN